MFVAIVLVACVCASSMVSASSESAFFIPRSFYKIDADGHQTPVSIIGAKHQEALLHRLKRSTTGTFSSSSSSSSTNGGRIYFSQASQQSNGHQ